MGRARSFAVLIGVLAAVAFLPGSAAAASFTWDLTSDFTTAAPGANPDKDSYGGAPWSYDVGGSTGTFNQSFNLGLAGWVAAGGSPFVAMNPGATPITNGTANYPAREAVLEPAAGQPAAVRWTSPVSGSVRITWSIEADQGGTPVLCPNADWSLSDNGTQLHAGNGTNAPQSDDVVVSTGETISLAAAVPTVATFATCVDTSVTLTITQVAPAPTVTLATPANGATITSGQPTFSGKADTGFGASSAVTVHVYSGSTTSGTEVRTLATTASGGNYSVAPSPAQPLPDGTYTAQAEQASISGAHGLSSANTFTLKTAAPTVTLNSPGASPLGTASPTLTGVAAHDQPVRITVYPGASTSSTPAGTASGTSGADGTFSIKLPALADGEYTVIASDGAGGISNPVTFRIKVHAPALTLAQPAAGGYLSQSGPIFLGAAGHALGDAPQVTVTLYKGSTTRARRLGTKRSSQATGNWVLQWPGRLALGTYTVRVSQADDAGHTTSVTHTFQIVPANSSVGPTLEMSRTGTASVPVWCTAPVGQTCSGTVLILTKKTYRTAGGGLAGRLRVMFAYVTIPGGGSAIVRRHVQAAVFRALRRARTVPVVVVATLRSANGAPRSVGVGRVVTVKSARRR